jgi:Polyketide synthase dehydratase N-terminal domain
VAPRLIELCFQAAGLWEMGVQGRMGLPLHIDRVSLLRPTELVEGRLYAAVTPNPGRGSFNAEVVDAAGNRYVQLSGYRTVALPNAIEIELLKPLQALLATEAVAAA